MDSSSCMVDILSGRILWEAVSKALLKFPRNISYSFPCSTRWVTLSWKEVKLGKQKFVLVNSWWLSPATALSLTGLFVLAYPNQEQQIHGHGQINYCLREGGHGHEQGWEVPGSCKHRRAHPLKAGGSVWKQALHGFIAIVWLLNFTNTDSYWVLDREKMCQSWKWLWEGRDSECLASVARSF